MLKPQARLFAHLAITALAAWVAMACDLSAGGLDAGAASKGEPTIPPGASVPTEGAEANEGQEGAAADAGAPEGAEGTTPDAGAPTEGTEGGAEGPEGGGEGSEGGAEGPEGSTEGGEGKPIELPPLPDADFENCDRLDESLCTLPFPSSFYLVPDANTETGYHVEFGRESLPVNEKGKHVKPDDFERLDGFPSMTPIFTYFPNLDISPFPTWKQPEASLDEDCPSVILNAATGERIPHFAELDELTSQGLAAEQQKKALSIRPLAYLPPNTQIIVALRGLKNTGGEGYKPSAAFKALRDGTVTTDGELEARRARFEDIFAKLETAGIARDSLDLAWDFHTRSNTNATGRLVFMRDDAFKRTGANGPDYEITEIKDMTPEENAEYGRRVDGTMTVPLYLTNDQPGAVFNYDESGMPKFNGTAEVPWTAYIPHSIIDSGEPGSILQYGHGLLGERTEIEAGNLRKLAQERKFVIAGTDWWGMSSADVSGVTAMIVSDISDFEIIPDRSHQGMLNALMLMRLLKTKLVDDPAFKVNGKPVMTAENAAYYGNSQGGILGTTYMAVTTDVTRGVLGVAGAPYSLLLPRSTDFTPFWQLMRQVYRDTLALSVLFGLIQMQWDSAEPAAYLENISIAPLPGTPKHDVLLHVAKGDHQVTDIGGQLLARAVGAKLLKPALRPVFDLEEVDAPYEGSAYVEFDCGAAEIPDGNIPPGEGEDPHGCPRATAAARAQIHSFIHTGKVEHTCDGPCDPE